MRGKSALEELETLVLPRARLREQELDADRPSLEKGRHPTMPPMSTKDHDALGFAKRVADRLLEVAREESTAVFALIAAPRFLGFLRQALSPNLADRVIKEVPRDFSSCTVSELADRLPMDDVARAADSSA